MWGYVFPLLGTDHLIFAISHFLKINELINFYDYIVYLPLEKKKKNSTSHLHAYDWTCRSRIPHSQLRRNPFIENCANSHTDMFYYGGNWCLVWKLKQWSHFLVKYLSEISNVWVTLINYVCTSLLDSCLYPITSYFNMYLDKTEQFNCFN